MPLTKYHTKSVDTVPSNDYQDYLELSPEPFGNLQCSPSGPSPLDKGVGGSELNLPDSIDFIPEFGICLPPEFEVIHPEYTDQEISPGFEEGKFAEPDHWDSYQELDMSSYLSVMLISSNQDNFGSHPSLLSEPESEPTRTTRGRQPRRARQRLINTDSPSHSDFSSSDADTSSDSLDKFSDLSSDEDESVSSEGTYALN